MKQLRRTNYNVDFRKYFKRAPLQKPSQELLHSFDKVGGPKFINITA